MSEAFEPGVPPPPVNFTLTRADWAFFHHRPRQEVGWRRWLLLGLAGLAGGVWGLVEPENHPFTGVVGWLAVALGVVVVFVLTSLILKFDRWRIIRACPEATEITVRFDEDGIVWGENGSRRAYGYDGLSLPVVESGYCMIGLGAVRTFLIPLRAFATPERAAATLSYVATAIHDEEQYRATITSRSTGG